MSEDFIERIKSYNHLPKYAPKFPFGGFKCSSIQHLERVYLRFLGHYKHTFAIFREEIPHMLWGMNNYF